MEEIEALAASLERLCGSEARDEALQSLTDQLRRVLIMALMASPELTEVARFPSIYLADAPKIVKDAIDRADAGDLISTQQRHELVQRTLLAQDAKRRHRLDDPAFVGLLSQRRVGQLRCELCGYHFRGGDLSLTREQLVRDAGWILAGRLTGGRADDPYKNPVETRLELDHLWPALALGSSRAENLALLCQFCNQGKSSWVYAGEFSPSVVAGALSRRRSDTHPPVWLTRFAFASRALRMGSVCDRCGNEARESELTVRAIHDWFPWNIRILCYGCVL